MRFLLVAFIVTLLGVSVVAQCPIQLREASSDATGKNFTIRYYNAPACGRHKMSNSFWSMKMRA
jgi:hypothetical protein